MATNGPKPLAPSPAPPRGGVDFAALLDQLKASSLSDFIFLKEGRTKVRLLVKDELYYLPVASEYKGRQKTKYAILAVLQGEDVIKALIAPKTVLTAILNLEVEGFPVFDPEEGHGVVIKRSGSGFDTDYSVTASPKMVEVSDEVIDKLDGVTLHDMVAKYERYQATRAASNRTSRPGKNVQLSLDDEFGVEED